ncbi:MAG: isochorismate synthase [Actinomycetales bacterium]|nr:isochorismate synthase [Actinomycetales bacterium]
MSSLALVPNPGPAIKITPLDFQGNLLNLLPESGGLAWVTGIVGAQTGAVGWGIFEQATFTGPERFSRAQKWWSNWCQSTGIAEAIAFTSFAFADEPGDSVVVIPEVTVANQDGQSFLIVVSDPESLDRKSAQALRLISDAQTRIAMNGASTYSQKTDSHANPPTWLAGTLPVELWQEIVDKAVVRIRAGELDKVVLARDLYAHHQNPIDVGKILLKLNERFPDCWTFSVAGLLGATPELLIKRSGSAVTSRVLAGTMRRSSDLHRDDALAAALLDSSKDQEEHEYAVASVRSALAPHCTDLKIPAEPKLLQLANVQHLATEVTGELADNVSALILAASLHPTAAVCGTPTERAASVIAELEGMARNRYAGPVGWLTGDGDGELGIALRCASIENDERTLLRLYAGCGIVFESTGELEVAESNAKFNAMREALSE